MKYCYMKQAERRCTDPLRCFQFCALLWDQMGEPSAVVLLSCSPETMSSRMQNRRRSSSSDRENALQKRAQNFCSDVQAVIAYYERKTLLQTVSQVESSIPCFST